jgi:hopene-associated glycosyltransferase HpnB
LSPSAWILSSSGAAALWLAVLLVPWRPWSTRERLDPAGEDAAPHRPDEITALVPARDEAPLIADSVRALAAQRVRVVVIDDHSADDTAALARRAGAAEVLAGAPLPEGWTGKLWALEQGWRGVTTPLILLVDADIVLAPGTVSALRAQLRQSGAQLASLVAEPRLRSFWERLLLPAFVYFFKLLYPFGLSNAGSPYVAAAAGGCILLERRVLERVGGFAALRGAIIDDCTLARLARNAGFGTWIGLTHAASSRRDATTLAAIWDMVARTAFTQLRYSNVLLGACTLLMLLAFVAPVAGLWAPPQVARVLSALACTTLAATYVPLLRYYGMNPLRALTLPVAGMLFLAMTWTSALRYWRGTRSVWKGRTYDRTRNPHAVPRVD